jgi:hypothetical protein
VAGGFIANGTQTTFFNSIVLTKKILAKKLLIILSNCNLSERVIYGQYKRESCCFCSS